MINKFLWLQKEGKKRLFYELFEVKKIVLKSLLASSFIPFNFKFFFSFKFNSITKMSSLSFYKNACFATALSRASFSLFKYSRHYCKFASSSGLFCGMRKSSF